VEAEPVQRPGVVVYDLAAGFLADRFVTLKDLQGLQLGGGVGVAVVEADVVLAGVLEDVGGLLGLAGDIAAVPAQHVLVELAGAGAVEAGAEVGDDLARIFHEGPSLGSLGGVMGLSKAGMERSVLAGMDRKRRSWNEG